MKIAIVYDCLFPNTVGGAERWYRNLAERLGGRHTVTYLTRRQWDEEGPRTSFETLPVAPRSNLYTASGRRRIWPPLRFGLGVFGHLLRHGRRYDAVHCASFPYFSLLGAGLALRLNGSRARLIVDWHELWSREYWRSYLGALGGRIGWAVQSLCLRLPDQSFTFSRLVEGRLRALGARAPIVRLTGEYVSDGERGAEPAPSSPQGPPVVLSAGRHIPEKRVPLIPAAVAIARQSAPELRCVILGDGPDREATAATVRELGLDSVIEMPGSVSLAEVSARMSAAACLLHPSEREGYGLVVVESVSRGTPAVVVKGSENAATELVEDGVNGFVAAAAEPRELAAAIVRAISGGDELRRSTLAWYERHAEELSIESSLDTVEDAYRAVVPEPALSAQARS